MSIPRLSRFLAGCSVCVALLVAAAPNRAADTQDSARWDTKRTTQPEDIQELKALEKRVKGVVDKCTPCTVAILIGFGAGSGVIVSEDGLVLTAAHVIAGEPKFDPKGSGYEPNKDCIIVLSDGKKVKGKTLGINDKMDSGMVKITDKGPKEGGKWPFLPIAKSSEIKTGQWVVSLGHPGGPKSGRGPVARLGQIEPPEKHRLHKGFVVSNCTLVGGDSGGPLFDLDGNVIGIHSRIGLSLNQNVHVPSDQFSIEWEKLVAGEVIGRQPKSNGAVVGVVFPEDENDDAWIVELDEEGPAAKAGAKAGDTITKFNGEQIKTVKRFRELVREKKPGDIVKLTVRRGVEILTLTVTLGKRAT
jgi:serine protease Do